MLLAGTGRTNLNPFWGVELTGWGYYLERRWRQVHDDLCATAIAVEGSDSAAVLVSLDLMLIDRRFTQAVREMVNDAVGLPASSVMLTCTHTHNAPAAGGLLGVGQCDRNYEDWAARQAATSAILAWNARRPARLRCAASTVEGISFNRTRDGGCVDPTLVAAMFEDSDGAPIAVMVNYSAHPTVATELRPWDVSRDVPGAICDLLEKRFPSAHCLYIQGACGDVNFLREFQTMQRCDEPAARLACAAIALLESAPDSKADHIAAVARNASLPTRRWRREELEHDRREALRRLESEDYRGWRETIGRSMTNRPDDMVARHGGDEAKAVRAMCRFQLEWTEKMSKDMDRRPEILDTEVQAIRFGPLVVVSNASELFSEFALAVRRGSEGPLMIACYANGRIGYLPDAHDIAGKSYAGYQSPKYCNQFPFTPDSGPVMRDAMLDAVAESNRES